jgi:GNAT superfamily N-acetyltransferase
MAPSDVETVTAVLGVARLYQGDGLYLVDWQGAEPTGHVYVALTDPPELQDLEVREAFRGRGIAASLLQAVEEECVLRRRDVLRVSVGIGNTVARALYSSRGFVESGVSPRRVMGTVQIRSGPIEVDDTLLTLEKRLS